MIDDLTAYEYWQLQRFGSVLRVDINGAMSVSEQRLQDASITEEKINLELNLQMEKHWK